MAKKFNFPSACTAMLNELGATPDSDSGVYYLELKTIAGRMRCHPYDDWLACQFEDVAAAKEHIGFGCLNPFSGKWNWHYTQPNKDSVERLRISLQSILPKGAS